MPYNLQPSFYSLPGVTIRVVDHCRKVNTPFFVNDKWRIRHDEFEMKVEGVASFYAARGAELEISPAPGANPDEINLYLYGDVLAALLHQRKIINFHASSFIHNERGIMVLGETGAGKSSMAAAFSLQGARFLSDDLTPVLFDDDRPLIWPVYKTIKLREETICQLKIDRRKTRRKDPLSGKSYFPVVHAGVKTWPLQFVLLLEIGDVPQPVFSLPGPMQAFSLLRSQVCSWEMLRGMPGTEEEYLHQLIHILSHVNVIRVVRPERIPVATLHSEIESFLKP